MDIIYKLYTIIVFTYRYVFKSANLSSLFFIQFSLYLLFIPISSYKPYKLVIFFSAQVR